MEIQILSLVLILTGRLVGISSIAARSIAVARLRAPSPRRHAHGRRRRLPPTSRNGGKLRAAEIARRAFCSPTLFAAAPAVNLPAAVSLSGERGCAGDPIVARTPGGAVGGAMAFSTTFRKLVGRTPTDYRRSLPRGKA